MKKAICNYSGEDFIPKCPVEDCPANIPGTKTGCAFLEVHSDKNKLSKTDMSRLFGVSPSTANKKFSVGKEEIRDMARLIMALTSNTLPGRRENLITLEGVFFSKFEIPVNRASLRLAARNKEIRLILKRRMKKAQYKSLFRKVSA